MSWFFKKDTPRLDLLPQYREFTERAMCFIVENLAGEELLLRPQVVPGADFFDFRSVRQPGKMLELCRKTGRHLSCETNNLRIHVFNEEKKVYEVISDEGVEEKVAVDFYIDRRWIDMPGVLVAVFAVDFLKNRFEKSFSQTKALKDNTVLMAIVFGFGAFVLDALRNAKDAQCPDLAGFPVDICLYAMALQSQIAGQEIEPLKPMITPEDFLILDRYLRAIRIDENIPSFIENLNLSAEKFPLLKQISASSFGQRQMTVALDRLLELDPGNKLYLNNRGYNFLQLGEYENAIGDFNRAIDKDPFWSFPFNNRGFCYLKLGQHERGKEDVDTALRLDPQNSYAYRNLGYYHYVTNNPGRAIELYHQALAINPVIDHIHFMMGIACLAMGEKEKAREEFDRSRAIPELPVPDYPEC